MFDAEKKAGQKIVKYAMKIAFRILYLAFLLNAMMPWGTKQSRTLLAGDYRCQKIAGRAMPEGLAIAPSRNDGINRLYVAGSKPSEITWNGSGWDTLAMGETIYARSIAAGFGRNDSVCRIYIGDDWGSRLWEYSYEGGVWSRVLIDDRSGSYLLAVGLGDIKNDDTIRVLAGGTDNTVIAYTYQAGPGTWEKDTLGKARYFIYSVCIGKGRNDDTNRVYAGCDIDIYEYNFRDADWDSLYFFSGHAYSVLIGCLKNDSLKRLYSNYCGTEYIWNGNAWVCSDTVDSEVYNTANRAFMGPGRGDSINRLYLTGAFNVPIDEYYAKVYFYEYTFADTAWLRKELSAVIWNPVGSPRSTLGVITIGDARNDGKNRVYGSCTNGEIFEWEWDDTLSAVVGEPRDERPHVYITGISASPNPFKSKAAITFNLPQPGRVGLYIYDISGRLVSGNNLDKKQAGTHSFVWDGKNSHGRSIPPGVYFVSLCVDGRRAATGKLVKIN